MRSLLKRFVILQAVATGLYLILEQVAYYAQIWRSLPLVGGIPFAVAQAIFLFSIELVLILFIFYRWRRSEGAKTINPYELLRRGEDERLERKSTLRWDLKTKSSSKAMERSVMKTVAAFMNSRGGHLLVGVGDDGSTVGIEHDYATLIRKDADGWETHFSNVLGATIGPSFRQYVRVKHFFHEGKACALVTVAPSVRPAYVIDGEREEFFIRTGNGTTPLKMSESHAYIASRFRA